ncbi:MAG: PglZ domain-containing protein, partial [Chloroflexi bacterium]|nr:PglZ domain-containing protein [Chloroflexota bacterium]
MLEDWILSKLRPLTGAPLIILRDPQRMIQPGAMAVDGWAEAHQYAAPFCYGNLSLRDMVEGIRDDPHTRLLLVDRSREDARVPLFYPDLSVEAGPDCQLTLTLRDCLVETTGDAHWPQKVNERLLSALILEHLPGVLQAHRQLREVDDSRFTDSDLDKIVMGAMLGINPFRRLTVSEIRRLCVEQHTAVAKLAGTISDEVTGGVYQMIGTAPKPFCWLLDRDPTWVIRAFTLAAILHQHKLDYDLLLSNLAPELHGYRGIEASFLDEALQDQLRADPDRVLEDVRDTETFLVEQPERLALLMRDSLHLDDARAARQALRREKLSPLVRSLALLSLLADLLIHRKLGAHKRILRELMEQEQDPGLMALRRPSESWEALRTAYKRAIEVLDQGSTLGKVTKDLQALDEGALTLAHFHELWNAKQLNRLDYYISDLDRMLRLGNNMLPLAVQDMWPELRERWEKTRPALQSTIQRWIDPWQNEVDALFQDLCRREYGNWIHQEDAPAIFTHQFLRRLVQPHWDPRSGRKAVILIFDGLRTDAWEEIVRPVLEERFDVMEERPGCALLPTETQLSRKA